MGLIKAFTGAVGGTLGDQWKEYFYCDALPADVLVRKGSKRIGGRSSNKHGSDNVITDGSGIAVADGQCLVIVNNGKVSEICAEPGEYTFNSGESPSVFSGSFGESVGAVFKDMIGRLPMVDRQEETREFTISTQRNSQTTNLVHLTLFLSEYLMPM